MQFVFVFADHHDRSIFRTVSATDDDGEGVAQFACRMIGILVGMGIEAHIKRSFLQQRFPQVFTQVGMVVSIQGNVMDKNAFPGFFECLGAHFLFQKVHLLLAKLGEVVQSVVHPMVVGLVFPAVEHDDAGIAPIECSVGPVVHIVVMVTQADGVGVADFSAVRRVTTTGRWSEATASGSTWVWVTAIGSAVFFHTTM